ncbi:MAG: 50S ribosomal protein L23 [Patescibacteria group bacterium]|nr:50S ribosomal protein L23 [Patescibacteria group bacterium]
MGLFKRKKSEAEIKESSQKKAALPVDDKKTEDSKVVKSAGQNKVQRAYRILIRPIISEKATIGVSLNKYVFEVAQDANKVEIKKAIKEVYGINPQAVNIVNQRGRQVRFGRYFGQTKNTKKAVVTLKKGDSIKLYEGI